MQSAEPEDEGGGVGHPPLKVSVRVQRCHVLSVASGLLFWQLSLVANTRHRVRYKHNIVSFLRAKVPFGLNPFPTSKSIS